MIENIVLSCKRLYAICITLFFLAFTCNIPSSLSVRIWPFQGRGRGSIPRRGRLLLLDIALDFLFYAAIPLAFAVARPGHNALAAAVLLAAFIGTGSSFLAFAVIAAKRGLTSLDYPDKSFYFLGGLTEATETLVCFVAMCVWPEHFALIAYVFAGLCGLTVVMRIGWGWRQFS